MSVVLSVLIRFELMSLRLSLVDQVVGYNGFVVREQTVVEARSNRNTNSDYLSMSLRFLEVRARKAFLPFDELWVAPVERLSGVRLISSLLENDY